MADLCPITPLRDGMNLVAKEYLATKADGKGVLLLSETAGAVRELGEALIINPTDIEQIVQAMAEGLRMPEKEQIARNRAMQKRIQHYDVGRWANGFIDSLLETRKSQARIVTTPLTSEAKGKLVEHFQKSQKKLLLLDYDGTLVPFAKTPEEAKPDAELLELLDELAQGGKAEVVLTSGRDRNTLEVWFGNLKVGLVAEHGAWAREKGKTWKTMVAVATDWKKEVRHILERAVDRVPGSLIEEKDFSLAWHYRKATPKISELRIREIINDLFNFTANSNLRVLEGSKVVEVKGANINKGLTALQWISQRDWDFILAVGDDLTDEDIYKVLPQGAWSIKVRPGATSARFTLDSPSEVRSLLKGLIRR